MGKRSRKRTGSASAPSGGSSGAVEHGGGTTRAERDAARRRRAASVSEGAAPATAASALSGSKPAAKRRRDPRGERPPAPWGSFPLVELCVLLAIVLLISGFVVGGGRGATMIFAGLALGSLSGLELAIMEHFAGYRSHTSLLAGGVALFTGTLIAVVAGQIWLPLLAAVAVAVFLAFFVLFRRVFKKRSGGLPFR